MYIDTAFSTQGGKTYRRYLLRESYREGGKVKHRTIANLSQCSEAEIAAIKLALRHKGQLAQLGSLQDLHVQQGSRIGAVFSLKVAAQRLGLVRGLGGQRPGKLALWQVMARLLAQGSRLSAVRLAERHAAADILGLETFNEDHLYQNLAWLADHQEEIEQRLFRQRYGAAPPQLFLYDVTSSYLEGCNNILAAFGYNRDGKKGKQQLVIGLLTGPEGAPVAVRVFAGNTADPKTVAEQIRTLAHGFGVSKVTLVGDRGMLKLPQIEALQHHEFHYITAITKSQIRQHLKTGAFQMHLFDQKLAEVEIDNVRYILRRNPQRVIEMAQARQKKLESLNLRLTNKQQYLQEHPRANPDIARKKLVDYAKILKIDSWAKVTLNDRTLALATDAAACAHDTQLDGCYVLQTDVPGPSAPADLIHQRYKDLAQVERAFRTFKNGHLEIRPTFVQTEASTRGHVFVVMLAYLLERELDHYWGHLNLTVSEALDELGSLRGVELTLGPAACQQVPRATGLAQQLLTSAQITLPQALPLRRVHVATRKKLSKD
jgi:transposase